LMDRAAAGPVLALAAADHAVVAATGGGVVRWKPGAVGGAPEVIARWSAAPTHAAVSGDAARVVVALPGPELAMVDVAGKKETRLAIEPSGPGRSGSLTGLALSADGGLLVVSDGFGYSVLQLPAATELFHADAGWTGEGGAVSFAPDGQLLVGVAGQVQAIDPRTGQGGFQKFPPHLTGWADASALIVADGDPAATSAESWAVSVTTGARVPGWKPRPVPPGIAKASPRYRSVGPGGRQIALFEGAQPCDQVSVEIEGNRRRIAIDQHPDCAGGRGHGTKVTWWLAGGLIVGAGDRQAIVRDPFGRSKGFDVDLQGRELYQLCPSADDKWILLVSRSGWGPSGRGRGESHLELWSVASGQRAGALDLASGPLYSCAVTAAGGAFLGWESGALVAVDLRGSKQPVTLGQHRGGVDRLFLSPDGTQIAAQEADQSITVWRAPPP